MRSLIPFGILTVVALLAVTATLAAQDAAAPARGTIEATWDHGKASITYGKPTWRDDFKSQMKDGFVWRLGNNDPTAITLTCGLMTSSGAVPPGEYKLACRCVSATDWRLVVYKGTGYWQDGLTNWEIKAAGTLNDKAPACPTLDLKVVGNQTLEVRFGTYAVNYPLVPVRCHPPVETTFARTPVRLDVMALPLGDGPVKDLFVGTATATGTGGKVTWDLKLTVDGDKATLAFVNDRPSAIAKDKAAREETLKRIEGRLKEAPADQKERIEKRLVTMKEEMATLEKEASLNQAYQATRTAEGKVEAREKPASELEFTHERPKGSIILKFGARGQTCTFDVNPRTFLAPRPNEGR